VNRSGGGEKKFESKGREKGGRKRCLYLIDPAKRGEGKKKKSNGNKKRKKKVAIPLNNFHSKRKDPLRKGTISYLFKFSLLRMREKGWKSKKRGGKNVA